VMPLRFFMRSRILAEVSPLQCDQSPHDTDHHPGWSKNSARHQVPGVLSLAEAQTSGKVPRRTEDDPFIRCTPRTIEWNEIPFHESSSGHGLMKTLLILRHAKSSWKDPTLSDIERPLNKRGRNDAPRMGRLLVDEDIIPDCIMSSTATRARSTAELVAEACGYEGEIDFRDELYLADPDDYLDICSLLPDDCRAAMVVGHNPGLEILVAQLTGVDEPFPTAALAQVALDIDHWPELLDASPATLVSLYRPREL